MLKQVKFAGRRIQWIKEEPEPILLLIVALTFIFGVHCLL